MRGLFELICDLFEAANRGITPGSVLVFAYGVAGIYAVVGGFHIYDAAMDYWNQWEQLNQILESNKPRTLH